MYLLYVDESGDIGLVSSPARYFILSGLVVHELRWHQTLEAVIRFRRGLRAQYGLKLREEIHAANFLHKPRELARIPKHLRLLLLRDVLDFEASLPDINILNVVVDKQGKPGSYDVFENAWKVLIQRFHNTISYKNFSGPQNAEDFGLLVVDRTDEPKLRSLARRMRRYNPVPRRFGGGYQQLPISTLVEDAVHRDSHHSYFIQLADVNSYFLTQRLAPCGYVRRKGATNYFSRLDPVLCKVASSTDPLGIVRL
jgi:hypothetical protein